MLSIIHFVHEMHTDSFTFMAVLLHVSLFDFLPSVQLLIVHNRVSLLNLDVFITETGISESHSSAREEKESHQLHRFTNTVW